MTGMLPWPRLATKTPDSPSMNRRPVVSVRRIPSPPTNTSGSLANSRICMKSRKRLGIVCVISMGLRLLRSIHSVPLDHLVVELHPEARGLRDPGHPVGNLHLGSNKIAAQRGLRHRVLDKRNLAQRCGEVQGRGHQDARLPGVRDAEGVTGGGEVGDAPALRKAAGAGQIRLDDIDMTD